MPRRTARDPFHSDNQHINHMYLVVFRAWWTNWAWRPWDARFRSFDEAFEAMCERGENETTATRRAVSAAEAREMGVA